MTAFGTETVESCRSLGMDPANLLRPVSLPEIGRNVPGAAITPRLGAGPFATARRARTQSGSGVAWVIISFVLLRFWWLRDVRSRLEGERHARQQLPPLRGNALGLPIRLLARADEVIE